MFRKWINSNFINTCNIQGIYDIACNPSFQEKRIKLKPLLCLIFRELSCSAVLNHTPAVFALNLFICISILNNNKISIKSINIHYIFISYDLNTGK